MKIPALALLLAAAPASVPAQVPTIPDGGAIGVTVDWMPQAAGWNGSWHSGTLHLTAIRAGRAQPEFGVSMFPRALAARLLMSNLDLGLAFSVPLPGGTLLLRGGGTVLAAFGAGAGAAAGVHYGASILLRVADRSGLRLDLLRRVYYPGFEPGTPVLVVGIGVTSLPGAAEP